MLITVNIILKGKVTSKTFKAKTSTLWSEYESCLELEIQSKMKELIECVPLWFVEDPEQVCQVKICLGDC